MTQLTNIGEAEIEAYMRVARADGTVEFYRIVDGENVSISEAEYATANKEG